MVYSPGTIPSQAENPRPFLKAAPLPIAAMMAVAVTGPMPGIATSRRQASFSSSDLLDHRIGFVDPYLQVIEFQLQLCQQQAHCARELGAGVFQDPGQGRIDMASPLRKVIPRSSSKPRIWLMTAVRRITQRSRTRCRDCRSSWSSLLIGTKRIFGRPTASAIASASM